MEFTSQVVRHLIFSFISAEEPSWDKMSSVVDKPSAKCSHFPESSTCSLPLQLEFKTILNLFAAKQWSGKQGTEWLVERIDDCKRHQSIPCTQQSLQGTWWQQQISLLHVALSAMKVWLYYPEFCIRDLTAGTETIHHVFISRDRTDGLFCHCEKVTLTTLEQGIHLAFVNFVNKGYICPSRHQKPGSICYISETLQSG